MRIAPFFAAARTIPGCAAARTIPACVAVAMAMCFAAGCGKQQQPGARPKASAAEAQATPAAISATGITQAAPAGQPPIQAPGETSATAAQTTATEPKAAAPGTTQTEAAAPGTTQTEAVAPGTTSTEAAASGTTSTEAAGTTATESKAQETARKTTADAGAPPASSGTPTPVPTPWEPPLGTPEIESIEPQSIINDTATLRIRGKNLQFTTMWLRAADGREIGYTPDDPPSSPTEAVFLDQNFSALKSGEVYDMILRNRHGKETIVKGALRVQ